MRIPSWLKAATITGLVTFFGTALVAVLGALDEVIEWIGGTGEAPDLSNVGRTVLAAFVGAVAFVVNAIVRKIRPPEEDYASD